MEILFKLSNTGGIDTPTVAMSNFKDHYTAINDNLSWATITPAIRRATTDYLIPHIGIEVYTMIATAYHGTDPLTTEQAEFLEMCQDTVAYFTMLYVAPELSVSASDMGMVEKGSSNSPTMPVAQWRYKEFKYDLTKKADKLLDGVIRLLEKYAHAEVTEFADWIDSSAYNDTRTVFFQSAAEFSRYVNINNSRRLFTQISQDILRIEADIDKIICEDQFNALMEAIKDGTATDDQNALIENIRKYIAPKAMAAAAPGLSLNVDGNGLSLSSYTDGYDPSNHYANATLGAQVVGSYILKLTTDADLQMRVMMNFIHSRIDTYPLISASDCYARYTTTNRSGPISTGPGGVML